MKHKITIYNEERVTMEGVQVTMKVKVDQFDVLGDWSGGETYEVNDRNGYLYQTAIRCDQDEILLFPVPNEGRCNGSSSSPLEEAVEEKIFMELHLRGIRALHVKDAEKDFEDLLTVVYQDEHYRDEFPFMLETLKGIRYDEGLLSVFFDPLNEDDVDAVKELAKWWSECVELSRELEREWARQELRRQCGLEEHERTPILITIRLGLEDFNEKEVIQVLWNREDNWAA